MFVAVAQRPPIDDRFITWQPARDAPRTYWPSVGVLDGARYVLDAEDGPVRLDAANKALPTQGLVFSPLIEGPIGHKPTGIPIEGQLTFLQGDTKQAAVAVVASTYAIIIQDAFIWRGSRWQPWLHSYSGRPGVEVFDFQFDGTGRVLALLGNPSGYELAQSRPGKVRRPTAGPAPCNTEVRAVGFSLLPTGELFVAGTACARSGQGALIEVWKPGATVSQVMNLEKNDPVTLMTIAMSPAAATHEVFVGGCLREALPFLASASSSGWRIEQAPETPGCIDQLAVSSGSVWAVIKGHLWEQPLREPWRLVKTRGPWAEGAEVTSVRVISTAAGEELWVTLHAPLENPQRPMGVKYALLHAALPRATNAGESEHPLQ